MSESKIFPLKLEDSLGIPLSLNDSVRLINRGLESIGIIANYYFLEDHMIVAIKTQKDTKPIYYSTHEIILTKLSVMEQNYHFN
ncbi:MAG: hypothetical protein WD876_01530 [Candidatus Pacearchaeota archaeon]